MPAKRGPLRPHEERPNYARREPSEPPPGEPSLGDSFLIVTEGEVTERMYFEGVRELLQVSPVTIEVLHPHCTDPEGLVRAAIETRDTQPQRGRELGKRAVAHFDHVWVLFDTDIPARQGQLGPALELARREDIHVGHSTPCVEFWLLLHFRPTTGPLLDGARAERSVSEAWGQRYDKREETFLRLWPALEANIEAAVERAGQVRRHHQAAASTFPANPGTELDLLLRALDALVQPAFRILRGP